MTPGVGLSGGHSYRTILICQHDVGQHAGACVITWHVQASLKETERDQAGDTC